MEGSPDVSDDIPRRGSCGLAGTILPGKPGAVLQQVVEREGVDLLVMGAYSHSRLRHLAVGSITAILQACEVPVLLVR